MSSAALRLQQIVERIGRAAAIAGRDPGDVRLIAVSKGRGVDEIQALIDAGQRDFGESRVQEAMAKWPPLRAANADLRLHQIGRLQSNKAADAAKLFDTVHSLDRLSLLDALARSGGSPGVYVQVNIGNEPQKGGCVIGELAGLLDAVRASPLRLEGLMAIPPAGLEPGPFFALLAELGRRHDVTGLSIGMSADFEVAVMLGATAVRVGTALFED